MEKLKIGDRVCNEQHSRFSDRSVYITIATVEKLTPTLAVLSNDSRLINTPRQDFYGKKEVVFSAYSDQWTKWSMVTEEILLKARIEKERQDIAKWFGSKQFMYEEKKTIYKTLNP